MHIAREEVIMVAEAALSEDKFEELYQAYYARVFAFVYSRVDNAELAKDIAAEVFERAYLKGNEVRNTESYGGWLFAIAKNVITSHYRRRQREDDLMDRMRDSLRLVSRSDSPEDHMVKSEWAGRLIGRVRLLPRREQELLSLKFDAELKNAEIARVMGMSEGNVRISVFRAVRRLREYIKKDTEQTSPAAPAARGRRAVRPGTTRPAIASESVRLTADLSS
jgi:RNA polymerase sigma-70 factor (ECF subfamily)